MGTSCPRRCAFPLIEDVEAPHSRWFINRTVLIMEQNNTDTQFQRATDAFIVHTLPDWLKKASFNQFQALRSSFDNHVRSQQQVHSALAALQPPNSFAKPLLQQALRSSSLSLSVDLDKAQWREERRHLRADASGPQEYRSYFVRTPAVQVFLQNFKQGEAFFEQTALVYPADSSTGEAEQVLTNDITELVNLCRKVDLGGQYQQHLKTVFTPGLLTALSEDKRLQLALAIEVAFLKKQLSSADIDMLRRVVNGQPATHAQSDRVHAGALKVLDCRVEGALAFERQGIVPIPGRVPQISVEGVILYLPGDRQQSLRAFTSWREASLALGTLLREEGYQQRFSRRIDLSERASFLGLLQLRLKDPQTDATACCEVIHDPLFQTLAEQQVQRIRDNARFLAVPTAQINARASADQLRNLQTVGGNLLNLAGLFVPVVGALLAADLVGQTVSQACEGAWDWSQGHQHEAIEHLLGVAETVVVAAAVAGGATLVARAFKRSAVVDQLLPIENDAGRPRLWSGDLGPYAVLAPPDDLMALDNGLLANQTGHWWRNGDTYYRVRPVPKRSAWQLVHPQGEASFGPLLEFNGERCWRLTSEQPLAWQGEGLLLGRLWPPAASLSAARVEHILKVADVDQDYLRGLLVENRPMPVALRDTLERFAVDARVQAFFKQLADGQDYDLELFGWCSDYLKLDALSVEEQKADFLDNAAELGERLFEHFSVKYLPQDPLLSLIQKHFKGLPSAYALDVLKLATDEQRQCMLTQNRVPLAVAEQARAHLQLAQLTRMREGLYLDASYQPGTVKLAFALLRQYGALTGPEDLELRDKSDTGPLLARLYPDNDPQKVSAILVRRAGRFLCYNRDGFKHPLELSEPEGLPEALAALLSAADCTRLNWQGATARERIINDLRSWLPSGNPALAQLVGMAKIKPGHSPMQRLADGRLGYLLSGRGQGGHPSRRLLLRSARTLYPSFNDRDLDHFVALLLENPETAYLNMTQQFQEYRQLDQSLVEWVQQERATTRYTRRRHVATELRRSWQLQGQRLLNRSGQLAGVRLSLIGLDIASLPTLPANTDFGHVTDLIMVGLNLQAIPTGFLRCFSRVRWLNLNSNALTGIPDDIAQLTSLVELRMARNRIRMTQTSADTVRELHRLQTLDLSFNPLGAISLQFRQLSRLRELSLRQTRLQSVPEGLEWCGMLELADLRDNQIAQVPETLLTASAQTRQALELGNNPLAVDVRERLYAPEPAPQIVQSAVVEPSQVRQTWLASLQEAQRAECEARWDALRAEANSEEFFRLLDLLTDTSDFQHARQDLSRRVWALLAAISDNSVLRAEVFELAAARGCVDRLISCFSRLEIRMLVAQASSASEQLSLLELARGLFRLDEVERIAHLDIERRITMETDRLRSTGLSEQDAATRGRERVDEIEVSLAYRIGLARTLNLPGQPRTMQFGQIAGVTQQQLSNAAAQVRWTSATNDLVSYISQRDFWIDCLRREHAAQFEQVAQPFWVQQEALQGLPEGELLKRSDEIAKAFKQAEADLIFKLTREVMRTWHPAV